jgi:hypothetical protein
MEELKISLQGTPSQIPLPIEEHELQPTASSPDEERNPSAPKSKIPVIRPDQYRVEIWRESKNGERKVRVQKI